MVVGKHPEPYIVSRGSLRSCGALYTKREILQQRKGLYGAYAKV